MQTNGPLLEVVGILSLVAAMCGFKGSSKTWLCVGDGHDKGRAYGEHSEPKGRILP